MKFYGIVWLTVPVTSGSIPVLPTGPLIEFISLLTDTDAQHTCRAEMTGLSFMWGRLRPRAAVSNSDDSCSTYY